MKNNEISSVDAKRFFVLAHDLTKRVFSEGRKVSVERLQGEYDSLIQELWELDNEEISKKMHPLRLGIYDGWYDSLDWTKEVVSFSEMGAYPGMQFMNVNFTTGSVADTAERLLLAEQGKLKYDSTPEEDAGLARFLKKTKSINGLQEFLYDNVPAIVVPGGMQRQQHYNDLVKPGEPLCDILKYDVDDGNSRVVGYACNGITEASVLVGRSRG